MRFAARVLLLSLFFAACAPVPPPQPEPEPPPVFGSVPERPNAYLRTLGGGWRIKLTDNHRAVEACQYGLRVGPTMRFNKTLYLRVWFENPLSASKPLVTDTKLEPWQRELSIKSPEVRGLRKGGRYSIRIQIFDHPDRRVAIGYHDQIMPSRLNVYADGSVKF